MATYNQGYNPGYNPYANGAPQQQPHYNQNPQQPQYNQQAYNPAYAQPNQAPPPSYGHDYNAQPSHQGRPQQHHQQYQHQPQQQQQHHQAQPQADNVQSGGHHPPIITDETQNGDDSTRCRDWGCAVFFLIHVVAMFIIGAIYIRMWKDRGMYTSSTSISMTSEVGTMLVISGVVAVVFSVAWLAMLRRCAGKIIFISVLFNAMLFFAAAAASIYFGVAVSAVIFIIFGLLALLYLYCVRNRIKFTEAILKVSIEGLRQFWGVFISAVIAAVLSAAYVVFWSYAVNAIVSVVEYDAYQKDPTADPTQVSGLLWFLLVLSLYWTVEVVRNIHFTATAGAIGTWWYDSTANYATGGALKRASTYSLGSIAFGSFLVAFLQTLRYMLRASAGNRNSIAAACLGCILQLIENIVRYINKYAYIQTALYGKDFMTAASDTIDLFKAKGFEMIINDDLTGLVVSFGSFIGGALNALIVGLPYFFALKDDAQYGDNAFIIFILCFLMGFLISDMLLAQLSAAATTTFVVWAEDADAMQQTRPSEFSDITEARAKYYS